VGVPVALISAGPSTIGLEVVQTALLIALKERLDTQLTRVAAAFDIVDRQIAQTLGQPYTRTTLEPVVNYYAGTREGVIGMPWDSFPALCVDCQDAVQSNGRGTDQSERAYTLAPFIDCFVRSEPFEQPINVDYDSSQELIRARVEQEGLVDRRAKRMAEAIVAVIDDDPSLGGLCLELPTPRVRLVDPFLLDSPLEGDQTRSRVFSMVHIDYTADTFPARLDASVPGPGLLPFGYGSSQ
jgi:hypothetical protein